MDIETTLEWFYFADADFDSATILNGAYRKLNEIVCYHCNKPQKNILKRFSAITALSRQKSMCLKLYAPYVPNLIRLLIK